MALNRREFLKIMGGTTAALAFPGVILQGCKKALEKASARTNVIWLEGLSCSGCSVSLLNKLHPDIVSVITEYISLNYQGVVMAGTGSVGTKVLEEAVAKQRKDFVLIVE
jgi:hydrogenase small subunit